MPKELHSTAGFYQTATRLWSPRLTLRLERPVQTQNFVKKSVSGAACFATTVFGPKVAGWELSSPPSTPLALSLPSLFILPPLPSPLPSPPPSPPLPSPLSHTTPYTWHLTPNAPTPPSSTPPPPPFPQPSVSQGIILRRYWPMSFYPAAVPLFKNLYKRRRSLPRSKSLPVGNYSFPFKFLIPDKYLPPSFEGTHGYIRYWVQAIIDRGFGKHAVKTKAARFTIGDFVSIERFENAKVMRGHFLLWFRFALVWPADTAVFRRSVAASKSQPPDGRRLYPQASVRRDRPKKLISQTPSHCGGLSN